METKTIKGHFFKAQKNGNGIEELVTGSELIGFLDYISRIPVFERKYDYKGEERSMLINGDQMTAETYIPDFEDYKCGMFLHKRDVNLPLVGTVEQDSIALHPIDLGEGRLMEVTYFMVHQETGILLYLSNRLVGNIKYLAYYFTNFLQRQGHPGYIVNVGNSTAYSIFLSPILNLDRLERIEELYQVKEVKLRCIAKQEDWANINGEHPLSLVQKFSGVSDFFEAETLYLELKTNRNQSLRTGAIRQTYNALSDLFSKNKRSKFIVRGKDETSKYQEIDLLNDQYLFSSEIKYDGEFLPSFLVFEEMKRNFDERLNDMVGAYL